MSDLNFCQFGGLIVGAQFTIPDNPSTFNDGSMQLGSIGCSQLTCTQCGAKVRNAAHFGSRPGFGNRAAQVYDTKDWRTLPNDVLLETPGYIGRFYVCRCEHHVECSSRWLDDDPSWETFDISHLVVPLPWRCAGHPTVMVQTKYKIVERQSSPHGRLYMFDYDYYFDVVNVLTGDVVKTFHGEFSSEMDGSGGWKNETVDGVKTVVLADDGNSVLVYSYHQTKPEQVKLP